MRCENRMERSSVPYTKGQRERRKGSSTITLNAAALDSAIAEALKSSFDLRDSMNVGLTGLGDLIASHADEPDDANDDGDSNGSKDDDESVIEGEPPAKKSKLDESGKNRYLLISKPTLQLTEHVGPAIDLMDGDLASLVDKIIREKANEDKITDLRKQHETPENCTTFSETKVNQGVWNNLDESARSTDLKFQKVQKSLVKGIIIIVTEVNKLMENSGPQNA